MFLNKRERMGINTHGKGLPQRGADGWFTHGGKKEVFSVELKANLNVQILKNVFIPMSKVTYQNNIKLIVYYFSRLSFLSNALAILYHL